MSFNEWKKSKLEDVIQTLIDYRGKTPNKTSFGVPLITAKVVKGGFIQEPNEFIAENDYESWMTRGFPKVGDVVLTVEAPLGEVAQIKMTKIALAQRIITLRGKENILDNSYLKYFLQSDIGQRRLKARETGTTVTGIKQSELKLVEIDMPDFKTQQRIASILSSLDDKIELNRQTNKTLETIAQTLFKEMCLPKGEELPEGWKVGVLFDVCKLIGGGTPKTDKIEYWENGNIDWISAKDITPNNGSFIIGTEKKITELGLKNSSAKLLPKLATIISARGTVGNVCIISKPMTISQSNYSFVAIYPNTEYYLFCIVLSLVNQLKQRAYGTIFDTITTNSLSDLEIIIPRKEILLNFNKIITPIFEQIRSNIEENQTLTSLRDSLLPKLMKGEIEV